MTDDYCGLHVFRIKNVLYAGVAEQADATDLKSVGTIREGSSPFSRTIYKCR